MSFKRRVPRKKIDRALGLLSHGRYYLGRILQVGEGGLMILSSESLKVSDRVLVTFSLKGEKFITSKATIRYELDKVDGKNQFGVEFDELPFQARREIRAFVASHSGSSRPEKKTKGVKQLY